MWEDDSETGQDGKYKKCKIAKGLVTGKSTEFFLNGKVWKEGIPW